MPNSFKQALLKRELTLGAWIQIGHPAVAEIFASAGFDWICVDMEHGALSLETMTNIFRTVDGTGAVPIARIPLNDPVWIHRSLDAGAQGLIIPMITTAEEAEAGVSEAKYPPRGKRGFGYSRANMHGMLFEETIRSANNEIAVIMQIEHKDAIPNLAAIAEVPDVDGFFIGPLDLSGSMGITGQLDHPDMIQALEHYKNVARDHSLSYGMHLVRPTEANIKQYVQEGYTMIGLGVDNVFLDEGSKRALEAAGRRRTLSH